MVRGPDRAVERAEVLAQMEPGTPETASTLSEHFPVHQDTVYNRLQELSQVDKIETKKPGPRSRVWWLPAPNTTADPGLINDEMFQSGKDPGILRTLARARTRGEPLTSTEIADAIDDTQDIVYNRLRILEDRGWVYSLKSGSTSKVWWIDEEYLADEAAEG